MTINKNSWHYKAISAFGDVPDNLCQYFWKGIGSILLACTYLVGIGFSLYAFASMGPEILEKLATAKIAGFSGKALSDILTVILKTNDLQMSEFFIRGLVSFLAALAVAITLGYHQLTRIVSRRQGIGSTLQYRNFIAKNFLMYTVIVLMMYASVFVFGPEATIMTAPISTSLIVLISLAVACFCGNVMLTGIYHLFETAQKIEDLVEKLATFALPLSLPVNAILWWVNWSNIQASAQRDINVIYAYAFPLLVFAITSYFTVLAFSYLAVGAYGAYKKILDIRILSKSEFVGQYEAATKEADQSGISLAVNFFIAKKNRFCPKLTFVDRPGNQMVKV
jgi:hypothetical protein